MLQLLQVQIPVHGNAATATKASSCIGNSATASKLATARNIKLQGAVNGNANFDGSGNITINTTQGNMTVVKGDIVSNGKSNTVIKTIPFPSGFNKDNCMVVSVMLELENSTVIWGYGSTFNSTSWVGGSISKRVSLQNEIVLEIRHLYADDTGEFFDQLSAATFHYKILLIKV